MQVHIRELAQSSNFDLTATKQLNRLNRHVMNICHLHKWPDFRRVDETIDTVADQEAYTYPATAGFIFTDITKIEMKDPEDNLYWKSIPMVRTELNWSRLGREAGGFPDAYLLQDNATVKQIAFRRNPDFAGTNNVRVTGYVEPTVITSTDSTQFRETALDYILVELVAADILDQRVALKARAKTLFEGARLKLSKLAGREIKPAEIMIEEAA